MSKTDTTDFANLIEFTQNKIADAFHVAIDPAGGEASTVIEVMHRVNGAQMKLLSLQHYLRDDWERQKPDMIYLIKRAMLPKARNRSDRIAKKMVKRMFPNLGFSYAR